MRRQILFTDLKLSAKTAKLLQCFHTAEVENESIFYGGRKTRTTFKPPLLFCMTLQSFYCQCNCQQGKNLHTLPRLRVYFWNSFTRRIRAKQANLLAKFFHIDGLYLMKNHSRYESGKLLRLNLNIQLLIPKPIT